MPHISNKKIKDDDLKRIKNQLVSIFDTAGNKRKSDALLREFLTYTENIMFSKRLAILFMLDQKISKNYISSVLSVSPSTISRISLKLEENKYPFISKIMKKNRKDIWDILEIIIKAGLPPKIGKGRWQWLNEIERRQDRKIFKS